MPAPTPRKNKTIVPQGRVPSQRSNAQPNPVAMTIATTTSMPMRNPRPAPRCKSALSGSGMGLPLRLARALSSRSPSRARGSGGPLSLMSGSAIPLIPAGMAGTARTIIRHPQSVNLRSGWSGQRFLSRLQRGKARRTSLCGLPQLVSAGEIDGDELRDAALGHRHAVQPVHARHRDAMMRDEQKARAGRIGGFRDDVAEAGRIGIVQRRNDLVDDAEPVGAGPLVALLLLGNRLHGPGFAALAQSPWEPSGQRAGVGSGNRFRIADHAAEIFRRALEPLTDLLAQPH